MLMKYRWEKTNQPEMENARLTSKLNAVRQRIKEVEAQLDEARRNAAFETKYKDDPYWKIAKKRYIETGDPASIENFRAKQDAFEEAEKNRLDRAEALKAQQRQQYIYDELDARRDIENALVDYDVAQKAGDKVALAKAANTLKYAKEHYYQVTGKEYKTSVEYTTPSAEQLSNDNPPPPANETGNWLDEAPLSADSGAKNAKDYGAFLFKFSDMEGKARLADEATKQSVIRWLDANKAKWADLGLDQTKVNSIKSRWSKEEHDRITANARKEAVEWWNSLTSLAKDSYINGETTLPKKFAPFLNLKKTKGGE